MIADAISRLRRFAEPLPVCELCAVALTHDEHGHLFDGEQQTLVCACHACELLFSENGRFRRVPSEIVRLEFTWTDDDWVLLGVPIKLAYFILRNGEIEACYPSAGGLIVTQVDARDWRAFVERHPEAGQLVADVQALLCCQVWGVDQVLLAPLDQCAKLAGLVRTGGDHRAAIETFFEGLRS